MAARPGSFLPSKNSRVAPPPVETREYWRLGWSLTRVSTKPVVSPPQMMVVAPVFSPINSAVMVLAVE